MAVAEGVMRRLKLRRRLRQRVINEGLMGKQRSLKRGKMSTKAEVKVETEAEKVAASTSRLKSRGREVRSMQRLRAEEAQSARG